MNEPDYIIFTDGSCSTTSRSGAWATVIRTRSKSQLIIGTESETTITRCELLPLVAGLRYINGLKASIGAQVLWLSDSEACVGMVSGAYARSDHIDIWAAITALSTLIRLRPVYRSRNQTEYSALCDSVCSYMRRRTEEAAAELLGKKLQDFSLDEAMGRPDQKELIEYAYATHV